LSGVVTKVLHNYQPALNKTHTCRTLQGDPDLSATLTEGSEVEGTMRCSCRGSCRRRCTSPGWGLARWRCGNVLPVAHSTETNKLLIVVLVYSTLVKS